MRELKEETGVHSAEIIAEVLFLAFFFKTVCHNLKYKLF